MPYNFDKVPSRRIPGVLNRWTSYPEGIISLSVADADFPVAPEIQQALHEQIAHGVLGYDLPNAALNKVIASRMKKLYDWDVDPDWVVYTAGVNNGYNVAARILCSPKKGYLIQTPVYNEFLEAEHKTGMPQRVAPLRKKVSGNRISYEVDYETFEREVKRSGMFLLCHPHNPVGKIFTKADLKRMAQICIENGVTIVSDEIHSELLLDDAKFGPLSKISRQVERNTITLIAASKAFNVPGLACSFAIIPNDELREKFSNVMNGMSIEASSMGLTASHVAFRGKADAWLKSLRRYLTINRDFVIGYVEKNLPDVRMTKPDATYLLWLDFSEYKLQPSPYEFFLTKAKVAFSPGEKFGKGSEQFVRLNFGTTRNLLEKALGRITKALGKF